MGIVICERIQGISGDAVIIQYIQVWYLPCQTCSHQNVDIEGANHNNEEILQIGTRQSYKAYRTHISQVLFLDKVKVVPV
jgi:hypothetical protein